MDQSHESVCPLYKSTPLDQPQSAFSLYKSTPLKKTVLFVPLHKSIHTIEQSKSLHLLYKSTSLDQFHQSICPLYKFTTLNKSVCLCAIQIHPIGSILLAYLFRYKNPHYLTHLRLSACFTNPITRPVSLSILYTNPHHFANRISLSVRYTNQYQ